MREVEAVERDERRAVAAAVRHGGRVGSRASAERDVRPRLDALRARADNARPALHVCAAEQPLERVVAEVFERVGPLQLERAQGADG